MYAVEVHTNVVGGLSIDEPATDLAVAMAIASSYYERPIGRDIAVIGELGEVLLLAGMMSLGSYGGKQGERPYVPIGTATAALQRLMGFVDRVRKGL